MSQNFKHVLGQILGHILGQEMSIELHPRSRGALTGPRPGRWPSTRRESDIITEGYFCQVVSGHLAVERKPLCIYSYRRSNALLKQLPDIPGGPKNVISDIDPMVELL